MHARCWLWDYEADRSVGRAFHSRPSEANDDVVANYRTLLLERVGAQRRADEDALRGAAEQFGGEIEGLESEVRRLAEEENELTEAYEKCAEFAAELEEMETEVTVLKNAKELAEADALRRKEQELVKSRAQIDAKQKELFAKLEQRPDVSGAVTIDFD
jgi:DNA repair exonuclease SbcCD ATPase subunit